MSNHTERNWQCRGVEGTFSRIFFRLFFFFFSFRHHKSHALPYRQGLYSHKKYFSVDENKVNGKNNKK